MILELMEDGELSYDICMKLLHTPFQYRQAQERFSFFRNKQ